LTDIINLSVKSEKVKCYLKLCYTNPQCVENALCLEGCKQ